MRRLLQLLATLCALLGVLLLVVSFTPMLSWMLAGMAVDWFEGNADVLVVLGGSMLVDGTGPQATLGYDSYLRCSYASWMLRRYRYRYVVLTGPDGLAENMARYLTASSEGRQQLLVENSARTTFENAEFVKNILARLGNLPAHPTIAILTSDYHTRRARLVFERQGMPVRVIPVPDVAKRLNFPAQRWGAFLTLADEFMKDGLYKLQGKI